MAKTHTSQADILGIASLLGKRSSKARLKKYSSKKMKEIFSIEGKNAAAEGVSGRPDCRMTRGSQILCISRNEGQG
jgi:hypothetical protein